MTLIPNDLDDDKIRVISAHEPEEPKRNKRDSCVFTYLWPQLYWC